MVLVSILQTNDEEICVREEAVNRPSNNWSVNNTSQRNNSLRIYHCLEKRSGKCEFVIFKFNLFIFIHTNLYEKDLVLV